LEERKVAAVPENYSRRRKKRETEAERERRKEKIYPTAGRLHPP